MNESGKAWVFGDNIDTDVLAPGLYMKGPLKLLAAHCLEAVDPDFAPNVEVGDVIVAQGDTPIRDFKQLQAIIEKQKGAEKLDFGVMHDQEKKIIHLEL